MHSKAYIARDAYTSSMNELSIWERSRIPGFVSEHTHFYPWPVDCGPLDTMGGDGGVLVSPHPRFNQIISNFNTTSVKLGTMSIQKFQF